jgi:hypothetical protein
MKQSENDRLKSECDFLKFKLKKCQSEVVVAAAAATTTKPTITVCDDYVNSSSFHLLSPPGSPVNKSPPPPPMSTLIPPPPPLPGQEQTNPFIPRPKKSMMKVNWTKTPKSEGTIWFKKVDLKVEEVFNLVDLQEKFSIKENNIKSRRDTESLYSSIKTSKQLAPSVLDFERAKNCEIVLKFFSLKKKDIVAKIYDFDAQKVLSSKDAAASLLKILPDGDEMIKLKKNSDELEFMAETDQFLYALTQMFNYEGKLKCIDFKSKYLVQDSNENLSEQLRDKLERCEKFCKSLKENTKIPKLFNMILLVGNYMNSNMNQPILNGGVEYGFAIQNLNQLINIKSNDNRSYSLLTYIVESIRDKHSEILNWNEEISLKETFNLEAMQSDFNLIESGLKTFEEEVHAHKKYVSKDHSNQREANELFLNEAEKFKKFIERDFSSLKKQLAKVKVEYGETMKFFCFIAESNKSSRSEEFCLTWSKFLSQFKLTKVDLENLELIRQRNKVLHSGLRSESISQQPLGFRGRSELTIDSTDLDSLIQDNKDCIFPRTNNSQKKVRRLSYRDLYAMTNENREFENEKTEF